jgi:hypothetical protein
MSTGFTPLAAIGEQIGSGIVTVRAMSHDQILADLVRFGQALPKILQLSDLYFDKLTLAS